MIDKGIDNDIESIFIEKNNQVDIGVVILLARRIAHISSLVEDQKKHMELRNDIIEHIVNNY